MSDISPMTPAAGAVPASAVKEETNASNTTMDKASTVNKFTPLNKGSVTHGASAIDETIELEHTPNNTPKKRGATATKDGTEGSPAKKTKGPKEDKEKATKVSAPRRIPLCYDDADDADKLLFNMKKEGHPMKEIEAKWAKLTGTVPAPRSLATRFARIRDNLTHLEPGEDVHLLEVVKEVEAHLAVEKWNLVSEKMADRCDNKYSNAFLQKQLKSLEEKIKHGTFVPLVGPAGNDGDADGGEDGEEDHEEGDEVKDEEGGEAGIKNEDEDDD